MQFMFLRKIIFLSLEIMNDYDIKKKKEKKTRKQKSKLFPETCTYTFLIGFFLIKGREKRKRKEAKKGGKGETFVKAGNDPVLEI